MACQDVNACQYACFKPSDTLLGLITDLQSSITMYKKTHPPNSTPSAFFTDRRFYGNQSRLRLPYRHNSRPQPHNRTKKRCFVCKKEGCWSNKHSKEEREESKAKFRTTFDRRIQHYITEYEQGDTSKNDDDSNDDNDSADGRDGPITAFITDYEYDDGEAEQFLTATVSTLANRLFEHALTKTIPCYHDQDLI